MITAALIVIFVLVVLNVRVYRGERPRIRFCSLYALLWRGWLIKNESLNITIYIVRMSNRIATDNLVQILASVPDIRPCRLVNKQFCNAAEYLPDMMFWRRFESTCENICTYGLPKMFDLVKNDPTLEYWIGATGRVEYLEIMIRHAAYLNVAYIVKLAFQENRKQMIAYIEHHHM
jgi:hypothetical protein